MVSVAPLIMVEERNEPERAAVLCFAVTCEPEEESESAAGLAFTRIPTAAIMENRKKPTGESAWTFAVGEQPHKQVNSGVSFLKIALI